MFFKILSKVNQVVFSSLPVYSSGFKALASIVFEKFCWQDCTHIFSKGHNSEKGHNPVKKKIQVSYFFMRNPYKKFQNSSIHGSKVMLCIKKREEWMEGRMDGRTDGWTNNPEATCPSNFFEVGGIITYTLLDNSFIMLFTDVWIIGDSLIRHLYDSDILADS